jgi:hypothetical protein
MDSELKSSQTPKPIPGWACLGIGVGFICILAILVAAVRLLSGQ